MGVGFLLAGCVRAPMAPLDLSGPGWRMREAAALWTPGRGGEELAGELWLADRGGRETLVQFRKQGIPMVTARTDGVGWEIRSSLRRGRATGRGEPPERWLWFQLVLGKPAVGWERVDLGDGRWRLEQPETGERMEIHPVEER
jgi:hypothetical protein